MSICSLELVEANLCLASLKSLIISFCVKITPDSMLATLLCPQARHLICAQVKVLSNSLLGKRQELIEQQRRQPLRLQRSAQPLQLQPLQSTQAA